jgi:1-deoxy-D-xylulose-5-phosphate synthase
MDRAGLVGDDGPTHHGAFDIAYLRCLPNIVLAAPRDEPELQRLLRTALVQDGPFALRYPRGEGPGSPLLDPALVSPVEVGRGELLREGEGQVALLGYGTGVAKALDAADLLAESGLHATVADARFAKPLDLELIGRLAADHELLVTVEEGVLSGGFGSAVWEALNDAGLEAPRIMRVGLPDRYVTHGKPALLHAEVGFTGKAIAQRIEAAVGQGHGSALAGA